MDLDKCLLPRPRTSKFPTKQQPYMSNLLDSPYTSAHSKNCQDSSSSSSSSSSDQSYNANNASGLGMRAMKKRRRAAHSHKLSYKKRRRDKFNKRMRVLRNLIPNCSKLDKESVLDEAIEYLKSLQLQLQIMPTFAGLCAPPTPILFPTLGSVDLRLRARGLQLFGLPLAGYGTRRQMPMNASRTVTKDAESKTFYIHVLENKITKAADTIVGLDL